MLIQATGKFADSRFNGLTYEEFYALRAIEAEIHLKCSVCQKEFATLTERKGEVLCWVCRRLSISVLHDIRRDFADSESPRKPAKT